MATESRAAVAKISAHETTWPLQALSTASLISSTTSNPLMEFRFGRAVFSPVKFLVSSNRTDPSHPCVTIQHIISNNIEMESDIHVPCLEIMLVKKCPTERIHLLS